MYLNPFEPFRIYFKACYIEPGYGFFKYFVNSINISIIKGNEGEKETDQQREGEGSRWMEAGKKKERRTSLGQKFSSLWVGARSAIFGGKRTGD